jgi:3-hydroxybutyryl-CoA dehydratase
MEDSRQGVELGAFRTDPGAVAEYLNATGDGLDIYSRTGFVPPLFLAASSLGLLLREMDLPGGAVHSLQEIGTRNPVSIGSEVRAVANFERPRSRAGLNFITAVCDLIDSSGQTLLVSKSTVMTSDDAGNTEGGQPQSAPVPSAEPVEVPASVLAAVRRTITVERLKSYANASGDDNPLHLDAEFASRTQFGGIIAHGMLTLAFVAEMMTGALGRSWLESGSMRVRFKGAAYLNDEVETWATVAKSRSDDVRSFSVGVRNRATGQELVAGNAAVRNS